MSRFGAGLSAAVGSLVGLFGGAVVGEKINKGVGQKIGGAAKGALIGMAAGAFTGAALAAGSPAAAGTTLVVAPGAPSNLPPLPPVPPTPTLPAPPVLTDAASLTAAQAALGQWWAKTYAANPAAVNGQQYVPSGTPATDPNFINALSFFQQYVNVNAASLNSPLTPLPYTNGTLDAYTLTLLRQLA
jgi:hypothetical protein